MTGCEAVYVVLGTTTEDDRLVLRRYDLGQRIGAQADQAALL